MCHGTLPDSLEHDDPRFRDVRVAQRLEWQRRHPKDRLTAREPGFFLRALPRFKAKTASMYYLIYSGGYQG